MNREQFEANVLDLWVTTRIPLSRAHLQYHTGVGRQKLNKWLDELTADGVLEVDIDDDGEMLWKIPGASRSSSGPRSFAELGHRKGGAGASAAPSRTAAEKPRRRKPADDADDAMETLGLTAMTLARTAGRSLRQKDPDDGEDRKSLLLSAGLSFLGPLGWLYAGSLREALPAAAIAVLVAAIVPTFLLMPLLWIALPASAMVGLVYAWQYNRHGQRTPLFLDDKKGKDASD